MTGILATVAIVVFMVWMLGDLFGWWAWLIDWHIRTCGFARPLHAIRRQFYPMKDMLSGAIRRYPDIYERFEFYRLALDRPYFRCPCGRRASVLAADLFTEQS